VIKDIRQSSHDGILLRRQVHIYAAKWGTMCAIPPNFTLSPDSLLNVEKMGSNNSARKPYDFWMEDWNKIAAKEMAKSLPIVNISGT